jgi:hypothetical protein
MLDTALVKQSDEPNFPYNSHHVQEVMERSHFVARIYVSLFFGKTT